MWWSTGKKQDVYAFIDLYASQDHVFPCVSVLVPFSAQIGVKSPGLGLMMWSSPVLSRRWDIMTGQHPSSEKSPVLWWKTLLRLTLVWWRLLPCEDAGTDQSLSTAREEPVTPQQSADTDKNNQNQIQTQRRRVYWSCVTCKSLHKCLRLSSLRQQELRADRSLAWPALRSYLLPCLTHVFKILLNMFPRLLTVYWLLQAGSQSHISQIIKFNRIGPSRQSSSTLNPAVGTRHTNGATREHTGVNNHRADKAEMDLGRQPVSTTQHGNLLLQRAFCSHV